MSEHEHWQLNGSAAELYQRYLVPAITSLWAADLIARATPRTGERVLDIACGTGAVTRLAAERMESGYVAGLDFNPGMLAVARTVPSSGARIEWFEGSALALPFNESSFDLILCQLGLQFFPDRSLALREMKRVAAPEGRLALSVYSGIEQTPGAHAFAEALDQRLGPDASKIKRAEHLFATPDEIRDLMIKAELEQVAVDVVTQRITFPTVLDYVRFQLTATPMASLLGDRNEAERDAVVRDIASTTQRLLDRAMLRDGRMTFPQQAYVATARRGR
jgi:ubiquinone/menaquinone biosynthesis C-methylase UbiE